jgi:hypothetical protein
MENRGGIAVYVTSHGFGHLNRTASVINRIPVDVPVAIRCHADLFAGWRQRLGRPANLEAGVWDSGARNPAGDSAATDGPATIALAREVFASSLTRLVDEFQKIRREGTAAVLCDAPAVPLLAAKRAGVPGFLLANFTWAEIYRPHARRIGADAVRFVDDLREVYRQATAVFRAEPALPMREIAQQIPVGLVVSRGRDRRAELRKALGIARGDKIVYFYIGRYGRESLSWERLGALARVHFLTFHPAPGEPPPNLHVLPAQDWDGADLAASTDAIVAKAGYGVVCEAMAAGTPIIYPPRVGFAEHATLDRALRVWGGGVPASKRAFEELRLRPLLERAFALRPGAPPFAMNGAESVAKHLVKICGSYSR